IFWRAMGMPFTVAVDPSASVVFAFEMLKSAALSVIRRPPANRIDLSKFTSSVRTAGKRWLLAGKIAIVAAPRPFARVGPVIDGLNGKFECALKNADAVMSHGS